jgi:hypothetical protein
MQQIDRKKIESSLRSKGFLEENTHHRYFHHCYRGKKTGISTFTSHGSSYKTYSISLIKRIKDALKLDTISQTCDLLMCPMTEDNYNDFLIKKGFIHE